MKSVHESANTVTVHVNKPVEEVYDFVTTAANWPRWHPATAGVSGDISHSALAGEVIVERVKHGLMRDTFRWKVEERQAPERWAIAAKSDRFKQLVRIDYTMTPEEGGTLWVRKMVFYFPKWYALMDKLVFSRILKRNSEKAVRQLKELLEKS
jgi:hypothetical protein